MHRFSVAYMHSLHSKSSYQLALTKVHGIGEKKAQKLLLHYKTLANMKNASVQELEKIAGLKKEIAEELHAMIQEIAVERVTEDT